MGKPFLAGITQNGDKLGRVTCRKVPAPNPKGGAFFCCLSLVGKSGINQKLHIRAIFRSPTSQDAGAQAAKQLN